MDKNEVVAVEDVLSCTAGDAHGNCTKAVLHQVPDAETSVFSVNPGETLAAHVHPRTWDLFFGISGNAQIAYEGENGRGTVHLGPRSLCAMPPGYAHEVRNMSSDEPVSFLLIHAPWGGYEFLKTQLKDAPAQYRGRK
jgi:mannose-6-phosphate isomerase-like protein (cupin superfamily)